MRILNTENLGFAQQKSKFGALMQVPNLKIQKFVQYGYFPLLRELAQITGTLAGRWPAHCFVQR